MSWGSLDGPATGVISDEVPGTGERDSSVMSPVSRPSLDGPGVDVTGVDVTTDGVAVLVSGVRASASG